MVAGVPVGLERSRFLPGWSAPCYRVLRCVGKLGLWGLYSGFSGVAPDSLARLVDRDSHSSQRGGSDRGQLGGLGEQMGRGHRTGILRQYGIGTVSENWDPRLNHLFRVLALLLARFEVSLCAEHIAGPQNGAADALSRNNAPLFFSLFPQAPRYPTVIPDWVSAVLLDVEGSWTSKAWMARLGLCLSRVCLPVLRAHMRQEKGDTCCSAPELT